MKISIQAVLKYTFFLGIAALLLYFVYGKEDFSQILKDSQNADLFWVGMSVLMALTSHLSRAWRWSVALQPFGFQLHPLRAFFAVMVGYFANTFVPRMGEISRCGVLYKTDRIPVNLSFGAVVTERVLDFFVLLLLTTFTILVEFDRIGYLLKDGLDALNLKISAGLIILIAACFLAAIGFLAYIYQKRARLKHLPFYHKLATFFIGLKKGLLSITKLSRRQKITYLFHTLLIWLMYYGMTYVLFFSKPEGANLGPICGLSVLIMGGIGIVIPTPGGVGSYHFFVGATLAAYGLSATESKSFAFLMHSVQTLTILLAGGISLLVISFLRPKKHSV